MQYSSIACKGSIWVYQAKLDAPDFYSSHLLVFWIKNRYYCNCATCCQPRSLSGKEDIVMHLQAWCFLIVGF